MPVTDDILAHLTRLYPKAIEIGLSRTLRILGDLGNPHLKMPPVIHIAGTNGKGSTLAFMRSALETQGRKCHVMTSPHLVRFNERLVIASREISDKDLLDLLARVEKINAGKPVTFFEITTAACMLAFAENEADYILLETGMGGRLDSTNVIENPLLAIITNISWDHTQHLGNSLTAIAREKAGIMKANCPCIIGPQTVEALAAGVMEIFENRAAELNAPLYRHGHEWDVTDTPDGFTLRFENKIYHCPRPSLLGHHQVHNAATAAAALIATGITDDFSGFTKAHWPARLQRIDLGLGENWEIFLDGGHNEEGGRILADQAAQWRETDGRELHLILGMLTTKDPLPFFHHLNPYIASATAIPIPDEKLAFTPEALADRLGITPAPDLASALKAITGDGKRGRILIAGSLYLAGNILKLVNYQE